MKMEFKLNYYFEKYKDYPLPNSDAFRKKFKRKEGKFPYLNELIVMIINYQVKTYGRSLPDDTRIVRRCYNDKHKKSKETWYI